MNKIYLLASFSPTINFESIKYFSDLDLAKKEMHYRFEEIRIQPGVHFTKNSELEFSFVFGWEEHNVSWKILEKKLEK